MADVAVIDAGRVEPRVNPDTGLTIRPTLGAQTGFEPLEQAVLELESGSSNAIAIGPVEETLFVLEGEGAVTVAGEELRARAGGRALPAARVDVHAP